MGKFYISDLHFGHENIISFCNRPFKSVEEMDEELIKRWNSKVSDSDTVYILGDLIYKSAKPHEYYLERLKGKKVLVRGNHDNTWLKKIDVNKYFEGVYDYLEISDEARWVVLSHYPLLDWNGKYRGSYHLHGHIHNIESEALRYSRKNPKMFNVSSDVINFEPMTLGQVIGWYRK